MPIMFPDLSLPDDLAHRANEGAHRAEDARKSREALEKQAREESRHYIEASRSRIILYSILAFVFPILLVWEWVISREIYGVVSPAAPWAPFVFCVAVAIYVSACFSENSSRFLLAGNNSVDRVNNESNIERDIGDMYGRPREINWLLNPFMGAAVGILFLVAIYLASRTRVQLLQAAGEAPDVAGFQVYLPMVLYAVEILFGIPTFLFTLWMGNLIHIKKLRRNLAQERDREISLSQISVRDYEGYIAQLAEYNSSQGRDGRPPRPPIPPNRVLRRLLADAGHSDMADMDAHQNSQTPSDHPNTAEAAAYIARDTASDINREDAQQGNGDNNRRGLFNS